MRILFAPKNFIFYGILVLTGFSCAPHDMQSDMNQTQNPDPVKVGGGVVGNGAGNISFLKKNAHWLPGNREKKTAFCIEKSQDFPVSKTTLRSYIEEAFLYWNKKAEKAGPYALKRNKANAPLLNLFKEESKPSFYPLSLKISIHYQERCESKEAHLITFYFGEESLNNNPLHKKMLDSYLRESPEEKISAAVRSSFKPQSLYSEEYFVWFSDKELFYFKDLNRSFTIHWNQEKELLRVLILHETGHIFGLPHISNSIMDERILEKMLTEKAPYSERSFASKYASLRKNNDHLFIPNNAEQNISEDDLFYYITKKSPDGSINAEYISLEEAQEFRPSFYETHANKALKIWDEEGYYIAYILNFNPENKKTEESKSFIVNLGAYSAASQEKGIELLSYHNQSFLMNKLSSFHSPLHIELPSGQLIAGSLSNKVYDENGQFIEHQIQIYRPPLKTHEFFPENKISPRGIIAGERSFDYSKKIERYTLFQSTE